MSPSKKKLSTAESGIQIILAAAQAHFTPGPDHSCFPLDHPDALFTNLPAVLLW